MSRVWQGEPQESRDTGLTSSLYISEERIGELVEAFKKNDKAEFEHKLIPGE